MNRLIDEKSPYLLQHADNPIDWRSWKEENLNFAHDEDKPIFLSIGYSSCHWCHVMAHESFVNDDIAKVLNKYFIPIKVDREERPDIDAVYMDACMAMNGSGGWPLTLLLTPDRKPFWAGTYLPRNQLLRLLNKAAELWRTDRESLLGTAEQLTEIIKHEPENTRTAPTRQLVERGVELLVQSYDAMWGGFSMAPKFPTPHNILFLLRYGTLAKNSLAKEMAEKTLEHMYRGGIFDHVGGGFSRYSTDGKWLVPHFEKMLYDNSLLALVYTEAYHMTKRDIYKTVVYETLDYVLTELKNKEGGFYCGQDADSNGNEGEYYLFSPDELSEVLGKKDSEEFCRRFDITKQGNFGEKSIPNLIKTEDWEHESEKTERTRKKVYEYRKNRSELHKDDKILTSWNGLMIAALSRAGLVFDEEKFLKPAEDAVRFIQMNLTGGDGSLFARWRDGEPAYAGKLDDYAFYIWGLLELYEVTFDIELLEEACRLTDLMLKYFFDSEHGGFFPYANEGEQLITRKRDAYDGAMPSGNSVAALVLSRLGRITGEEKRRNTAALQFEYLAGAVSGFPAGHCFALMAMTEELWPTAELVCISDVIPEELIKFLRIKPRVNLTVIVKTPVNEKRLSSIAPFTSGYPKSRETLYCLCRGKACTRPTESINDIEKLL